MYRNLFILPDGRELFSGTGQVPAIRSVSYTQAVMEETDFLYGAACAAMVEATLIDTSGTFTLEAGDELAYYTVDAAGTRTLVGRFLLEKPTKPSPNTCRFTAYDRMLLLDKDLTAWLTALDGWPYTMDTLLSMVCEACGLALDESTGLLNGTLRVSRFLRSVTGRQLIKWIAGANAAYAHITAEGKLAFSSFTEGGDLTLPLKELSLSDYATAPIEAVALRQSEDDLGITWPENAAGEAYTILDNPLLTAFAAADLLPCLENIAGRVLSLSYTPATLRVIDPDRLCAPGMFLTVTDRYGTSHRTAVFSVTHAGGIATLQCTGTPSRDSATAAASRDRVQLTQGRVARLKASLEEVSSALARTTATLNETRQEQASLTQTVSGIDSRVSAVTQTAQGIQGQVTALAQRSDGLDLSVTELRSGLGSKADKSQVSEITEHFRFASDGLTISNSATGMGIGVSQERVIFTGGESPTTVIRPSEMETTNLRVGSRLDLGAFSLIPRTNGNLSLRYTAAGSN